MLMIKLYHDDNTIHQHLLPFCKKIKDMDTDTFKQLKLFEKSLSKEELKEFRKIRKSVIESVWRKNNKESRTKSYHKNKDTSKVKSKIWRQNNPERLKHHHDTWVAKNKKRHYSTINKWKKKNKDKINEQARQYRKRCPRNTPEHRAYVKEWRAKNEERVRQQTAKRVRERRKNDKLFAIKEKFRSSVNSAFSRLKKNKPSNTQKLLGCTWEEAKAHIERLWEEGMSWENHGRGHGKWNIDHIRPVSSFKDDELHLMNLIKNLQPLWFEENILKGNKW